MRSYLEPLATVLVLALILGAAIWLTLDVLRTVHQGNNVLFERSMLPPTSPCTPITPCQ